MFCVLSDNEFDELELQVVRYKPEGLDTLCRNTKFSRKELQIMYRGFKQVSNTCMNNENVKYMGSCSLRLCR